MGLERILPASGLRIPPGAVTTVVDCFLVALICSGLIRLFRQDGISLLALSSIGAASMYLIGDTAYGVLSYIAQASAANTYSSLLYVVPYIVGMGLLLIMAARLWGKMDPGHRRFLASVSIIAGLISFIGIVYPALFLKVPKLVPILAILTVVYTVLEVLVFAAAFTVAAFAGGFWLQWVSLGIAILHASDIALRFQSVRPDQMVFGAFEYGWVFGLALIVGGLDVRLYSSIPDQTGNLPGPILLHFKSIRGVTLFAVFSAQICMILVWLGYSYFRVETPDSGIAHERVLVEVMSLALNVLSVSCLAALPIARQVSDAIGSIARQLESESLSDEASDAGTWGNGDEIRNLKSAIMRSQEKLRRERDESREHIHHIAHDLRTPVSAIRTAIPMLQSGDSSMESGVELIRSAVTRVDSLAQSALDARNELLDFRDLGSSVFESIRMLPLEDWRGRVIVEGEPPQGSLLLAGFGRVFSNALVNAFEASPGNENVHVVWENLSSGVSLSLIDRGGGLPAEILEAARRGVSRSTKKNGNGIGLRTCFDWSRSQGVFFEVDSGVFGTRLTWRFRSS